MNNFFVTPFLQSLDSSAPPNDDLFQLVEDGEDMIMSYSLSQKLPNLLNTPPVGNLSLNHKVDVCENEH